MKKNYLLLAAFASAMTFAACSNDELGEINQNPPIATEVVEGATIEIALSSPANGTTKNVRPIGNSAASNNVTHIQLKAYKWDVDNTKWTELTYAETPTEGTNIAFKYVSGDATNTIGNPIANNVLTYNAASEEQNPGDAEHTVKTAKLEVLGLQVGTKYQFVAIGFNDEDGAMYPYNSGALAAAGEGFQNGVFKATVGTQNGYQLEEIFADNATADAIGDGKDIVFAQMPSLTLTRQVAGILAYFKDVPMYLPKETNVSDQNTLYRVDELQIVANHKPSDFYFPAELLNDEQFNGVIAAEDADAEDVLIKFDLDKIATNYMQEGNAIAQTINASDLEDKYEFYTFNNTSATQGAPFADGYSAPSGLQLVENSIFGAKYLLPYDKAYSNENTLVMRYYTEKEGQLELLQERVITTSEPGFNSRAYDIRCNNFYSIGQKLETDNTDDDEPVSLKGKDITLRINDAWDILHNMGVDNIE